MCSPCGVCFNDVHDHEKAVQCEIINCMLWFHIECIGVSDGEYSELCDSDDFWECPTCRSSGLPQFNSVDSVDVFHFDFQQNLPTPKLSVSKQFYLRLLWTYLFGIYSASARITTAFMWHEMLARRGCNDVISCLSRFIMKTPLGRAGAKWSIWWADNCPGQNKNNYIMWFFQDLIRRGVYSRIDYKFLIAGHTYGATDQTFGVIERYTSKIETVYTPEQWYQHVRNASIGVRSVEVVEIKQELFRDFRQYFRQIYTERNKDDENKPLEFQKVVWFNFGKGEKEIDGRLVVIDHPNNVWVRNTYNVKEIPRCVSYFKKRNCIIPDCSPPPLYPQYPIPIKIEKAQDLKKLVNDYVPMNYQNFYAEMPTIESGDSSDEDT